MDKIRSAPENSFLTIPTLGLIVCALLALGSLLQGAHTALLPTRSQDMQWSGEHVLLQHIDPWAEYLRGDPNHRFLLTQIPNYLPILYVLCAPLGFLSPEHAKLVWVGCNIVFALISGLLTARFYGFAGRATLLITSLLLLATPTRNTFSNGQQGLFVLVLWCLALLAPTLTRGRSALAGLSFFKFNFAPPVFLYLLLRGGLRAVLFSILPAGVGVALVWLWLTRGRDLHEITRLIVEPLAVSRIGYFPSGNNPNLMDVLQTLLLRLHVSMHVIDPVILLAAILLCAAVLYLALRNPHSSVQGHMALLATMSFCLFRHHDYDSVVLLFPFTYALSRIREVRAQVILALGVYLWYLRRIVDGIHFFQRLYLVDWVLLMAILYLTYQLTQTDSVVEAESESQEQIPEAA